MGIYMKKKSITGNTSRSLFDYKSPILESKTDFSAIFRKLYYYLYTNSQASRAERIVSDLSFLLLLKVLEEKKSNKNIFTKFLANESNSSESLLLLLHKSFPALVDGTDKFSMGDAALRESLRILEDINLINSPAHVLGDAFQSLIGPRLRGDKGQFFTPQALVRAMVRVVAPKPNESILDPACGTGGFLTESHQYQLLQGHPSGVLVGLDKDIDLFRIASSLLMVICGKRANLLNANSLDPKNSLLLGATCPQFDVVLTNPPFGSKIGVRDKDILQKYMLAFQWIECGKEKQWRKTDIMLSVQDPQILFLELCVRSLKPGGRLGIVLPEGVFGNKRTSFVWEWLKSQGRVTALLDCPRTTFQPGTDTKTNVLFFQRSDGTTNMKNSRDIRVAVAVHCGHDRRGRTLLADNTPYPDDFARLSESGTRDWQKIQIKHPDYWVPRYYAKSELSGEEKSLVQSASFMTLGELRDKKILSIRKGHEVGSHAYGSGNIPFVRTSDVNNFEVSADPTKSVSESIYEEYARQQNLKPEDILMVVDGRYRIGTTALLTDTNYRCIVQSHFRIISIMNKSAINPYELMFAFTLPSVKSQLRNLVFIQSTLGTLGNRLLELTVPIMHGIGPWTDQINQFRDLLKKRDESLAALKKIAGNDTDE